LITKGGQALLTKERSPKRRSSERLCIKGGTEEKGGKGRGEGRGALGRMEVSNWSKKGRVIKRGTA